MRQPLSVATRDAGPKVAAMNATEFGIETAIPDTVTLHVFKIEIVDIFHTRTKTGGTHQGAIGAGQAALGHFLPAGVLQITMQQFANAFNIDLLLHGVRRVLNSSLRFFDLVGSGRRQLQTFDERLAGLTQGPDHKSVVKFGQHDISQHDIT